MNVRWLVPFETEKEKTIAFDSKNSWHSEVPPTIRVKSCFKKLLNLLANAALQRLAHATANKGTGMPII